MSKYERLIDYEVKKESPLVEGESLLWSAKPKKNAFIINKILGMMPIALIWLAIDLGIIIGATSAEDFPKEMAFFFIPFFALHLMPVWIWLGNVLTASKKWKNTKYYVTDKRIIIETGLIGSNYQTIYYKDIRNVTLRVGMIDKMLGVGDIYFELGLFSNIRNNSKAINQALLDVENPQEIYTRLQKIVLDIQTDIEYPNALRPEENPGYNTKYKG